MSEKKVSLSYIENKVEREAVCKKRSKDLIKDVKNISFQFGVEACVVICNKDNPEPLVWPSKPEALAVYQHLKHLSEVEKLKKHIQELRDQLKRTREENKKIAKELFKSALNHEEK